MIRLRLTRAELDAYVETLKSSHRIRLNVEILNHDEKPIGSMTAPQHMVVSGSVDVDATDPAAVSRILSLTLLDPQHKLTFTPDNPHQAASYADNFIAVRYCVQVREIDRQWVHVPVFWGPITDFNHDGDQVTIEAQGKESLGMAPHVVKRGYTIRKNMRIDDAIKKVMRATGERKFAIPRLSQKVANDIAVRPGDQPWLIVIGGEDSEGQKRPGLIDQSGKSQREAFYDGRGRLVVRRTRKARVHTFGKRYVVSEPGLDWDLLEARNYVKVNGGRAKGAKHSVYGSDRLPSGHPLSAETLARNGEPRYLIEVVDATNLTKESDCNDRAKDTLKIKSKALLTAEFETLPVPHLEPHDKVAIDTGEGRIEFDLQAFSLPLAAEAMSIGFTKKVKLRDRRKGKGKKGKGKK